jgi:rhamnosyltransferase
VYEPAPEVVVVDSESTDTTVVIVKKHRDIRLIEIRSQEFSYGRSLNVGFEAASGEIIVSLSAHAFPADDHWLCNLVSRFVDPGVAGVYGRQLPHAEAWPPIKRDYRQFFGDSVRIQTDPENIRDHYFSNAASAIRKECWRTYQFDERLSYCEDWDWARAMLKCGFKIVYEPAATVYHSHNESVLDVYRRCMKEATARISLYGSSELRKFTWQNWLKIWKQAVFADSSFIRESGEDTRWILWSVVYRFFWASGWSMPRWGK